jgi:hypothetical protein
VSAPVQLGDSGGPAVDGSGAVRGLVVRTASEDGGVLEGADAIRGLLDRAGVSADEGPTTRAFRTAMDDFWRLDYAAARPELRAVLAMDPTHTVARGRLASLRSYQRAGFDLVGAPRVPGVLLALGVLAALAAVGCGLGLLRAHARAHAGVDR